MALGIPRVAGFEGHDAMIPAAILGALLGLTRIRTLLYVTAATLALAVAVVAYTPIAGGLARSLIRRDPVPAVAPGAVVVLGADITADSLLVAQSLDRMLTAVELVKRGAAPVLLIPGNVVKVRGREVPSTPDQLRLIALAGVGTATLLVSDSVASTRDEAVRARDLLRPRGIRRVYLVTSPLHSWRACRTFERAGIAVTCTPSLSRDVPLTPGALVHSRDRLAAFRLWLYEQAASAYYHAKGWI